MHAEVDIKMKHLIAYIFSLLLFNIAVANSFMNYTNNIHSIKCLSNGYLLGKAIVKLNSNDKINISFDEVSDDARTLQYNIVHCNADWTKSDIIEYEYLSGGFDRYVNDVQFSLNTHINYTHYSLIFPDESTVLKISGNYKLEFFDISDPDNILFYVKFYVTENKVDIVGKVIPPKRTEYRRSKQELEFEIHSLIDIQNAYSNMKVFVQQNERQDDIRQVQPSFTISNVFTYKDDDKLIFDAGDEYRNFDTRSIENNLHNVEKIYLQNDEYHINLYEQESNVSRAYTSDDDINGEYVCEVNKKYKPELEGEYVYMNFFLKTNYVGNKANVYLIGELTDWQFDENNRMIYDFENNRYALTLLLKQGFYDFAFAYKEHFSNNSNSENISTDEETNSSKVDISYYEGSHYQTKNVYNIFVYYRSNSDNYDRLLKIFSI
ncbi:hypothetical protein FACS1894153_1030 [Bacteroidia bacterium]|nr:hypothetical protein FACS1894153_1030 [Bacteroidia bacterium]